MLHRRSSTSPICCSASCTWIIITQVDPELAVRLQRPQHQLARRARLRSSRLDRVTAPLYRPIRRILPDFGGIDFSPLVILILIQVIKKLLAGVVMPILRAAG